MTTFADALAAGPRIPIAEADFGAAGPELVARATELYGWPDGTIDQAVLTDYLATVLPPAARDLGLLADATAARETARSELAEAEARWREELRAAYRAGATAAELAEAVGLSQVRVSQLVAGARPRRK